nr:mitochondrial 2-oxodicarboxylate carrier isoform X1 [Onthophagus taurus]
MSAPTMIKKRPVWKEATFQIFSGGSAGFIEVCIMHPLDLIKTRLQIQSGVNRNDPKYYTGVFDAFRKMYKHEGITSYWKGIVPPILVETPKRALKFFSFEQYKKLFMFGSPVATPITFTLAGAGTGITEAILVNPFEVVKVALQANKKTGKEVPSTWNMTRQIINRDGFGGKGLNKGLTATIGRNGVFNTIYFSFYHSVKGFYPPFSDPRLEFLRKLGIGFVSGTLASLANIPFDVAKSRIQGPQPIVGSIKYFGTFQAITLVYKEEGFFALYKGTIPKIMRLGPGGAIMLLLYEYVYEYLDKTFPENNSKELFSI